MVRHEGSMKTGWFIDMGLAANPVAGEVIVVNTKDKTGKSIKIIGELVFYL
jgi:hypothetical protein